MIKFTANHGKTNKDILGFGLTKKNIEQLIDKGTLFISGTDLTCTTDYIILYGETEKEIMTIIKNASDDITVCNESKQKGKH
jgi:hypothetical protein